MTHGHNKFFLPGAPAKGLPHVFMVDASAGVRINHSIPDQNEVRHPEKTTQFPANIMLASTFNTELAKAYGEAVGYETRMAGAGVLLGPGMNIYRSSQCGRNFEYLGEDPYLAGQMVANYVTGMQGTGTMACLKHFLCNNTEFYRKISNSIVDERAIMEIYTPAFKAGIDAGAGSVMTAYNLLNGEWAGQSKYVITDLLRGTLGFKGLVMTDWRSIYDWKKLVLSGQNVEMPGTPDEHYHINSVRGLLKSGELTEKNIDAASILGLGIGVPGPVSAKGIVNKCINLGWGVFNIAEELSSLTGFPVKAGNDANVAALGEFWKGGGQGCDNMVFVTLGTGVGGGIVAEGHLLHGAHTGQDDLHSGQGLGKAHRPGGRTPIGVDFPQQSCRFLRQCGQAATLHRLHDDDLFAVPRRHLIAGSGLQRGALPVQIVDLQLNIIHLRVAGQDLIQQLGAVMIGKADLLCKPLFLQLREEFKLMELFCDAIVSGVEPVKQVHIEPFQPAALALLFKIALAVLFLLHLPGGQLIRHPVGFPGVAGGEDGFQTGLAGAAQISVGGVKVGVAASFHKAVDHGLNGGKIQTGLVLRIQPGQP